MTNFTDGPWSIEKSHDGPFTGIGEPICVVGGEACCERVEFTIGRCCDFGPHGDEQTTANAKLIAASPDAYEIISAIHEFFRHHNPVDPSVLLDDDRTMKQAVAAYMTAVDGVER